MQITHLFKDVLHGNGRFVLMVNVSQEVEEFNETKRVLQVIWTTAPFCEAVRHVSYHISSRVQSMKCMQLPDAV